MPGPGHGPTWRSGVGLAAPAWRRYSSIRRTVAPAEPRKPPDNSPRERGSIGAFKAKLWDELLNGKIFYNLEEVRVVTGWYPAHYSNIRPHRSFGYRLPPPETVVPDAWLINALQNPRWHRCRHRTSVPPRTTHRSRMESENMPSQPPDEHDRDNSLSPSLVARFGAQSGCSEGWGSGHTPG